MQHIVQRMQKKLELPSTFTFACRRGGLTELEEGGTDGGPRAYAIGAPNPAGLRRVCEAF